MVDNWKIWFSINKKILGPNINSQVLYFSICQMIINISELFIQKWEKIGWWISSYELYSHAARVCMLNWVVSRNKIKSIITALYYLFLCTVCTIAIYWRIWISANDYCYCYYRFFQIKHECCWQKCFPQFYHSQLGVLQSKSSDNPSMYSFNITVSNCRKQWKG